MEGVKGVTSAFVGSTIMLLVDHDQALDQAALAAVLDPLNVKISGVQKADKPPF